MTARRHPRDGMRARWIGRVLRAQIDGETRALLLYLALSMGDRGTFTGKTRDELADVFEVTPRRIAERFQRAQAAGLLCRIAGGYNNAPAVWEATLPSDIGAAS